MTCYDMREMEALQFVRKEILPYLIDDARILIGVPVGSAHNYEGVVSCDSRILVYLSTRVKPGTCYIQIRTGEFLMQIPGR